jgi:hypothetical protein
MKNKSILLVEDDSLVKGSIVRDFKKTIDDPNIGLFQSIKLLHCTRQIILI